MMVIHLKSHDVLASAMSLLIPLMKRLLWTLKILKLGKCLKCYGGCDIFSCERTFGQKLKKIWRESKMKYMKWVYIS